MDTATPGAPPPVEQQRPSVLLICVDDLRPELGCYGADHAITPHLDAFAASALRFDRHYVQHPTCGAARFAMLTGRGPTEPAHFGNGAFATLAEGASPTDTLPGAFRAAGYRTVGLGKISHSHDGRRPDGSHELPLAWDELPTDPGPWREARHLLHGYGGGRARIAGKSPISERAFDEDLDYPDAHLARQAVEALGQLATQEQPFLLAVGFFKPHLPFAAPRPYWDLYDRDRLPPSTAPEPPGQLPEIHGVHQSGEVTHNYSAQGYEPHFWSEAARRHLRHGYLAATSYVDAQIGQLLDEVERLELEDELVVVVWGDHGWHLGELGLFGKHTPYEASLRSALLVRAPGRTVPGSSTEALFESRGLYPLLAALCGVPAPEELQHGPSPARLLEEPTAPGLVAAESWWRRGGLTAHSLRTASYRSIEWTDRAGEVVSRELYDLSSFPFELTNVAGQTPHEEAVARELEGLDPDRSR